MDEDLQTFSALRKIASLVNAGSDPQETIGLVLRAFCRNSPWAGAVIMRVDHDARVVEVLARHDPGELGPDREEVWDLDESPARIALATGEPVVIPDVREAPEFPGYQREGRSRGYRTVVVLPMRLGGPDGDQGVLAAYCPHCIPVSPREIAVLQLVVHLGVIAIDKARSLVDEQAFAQRLRTVLDGHAALLEEALAQTSVGALVRTVGRMMPMALAVADLTARRLTTERSPWPEHLDETAWSLAANNEARSHLLGLAARSAQGTTPQSVDVVLPLRQGLLRAQATISPLRVDGALVGALILFAPASELGDLDHLVIDSARFGLSVQLMRAHVKFATEAQSLEDLVSGLLLGTMRQAEIEERAARLDLAIDRPTSLIVFGAAGAEVLAGPAALEALRAVTELGGRFGMRAAGVASAGAIVLLGPAGPRHDARTRSVIEQALEEIGRSIGGAAIAVRSRVCRTAVDYPSTFRDCLRVLDLGRRFGRSGEQSVQDFGAFPILMSAIDTGEMRSFVQDLIGGVTTHDTRHGTAYLATLASYLDHGCRAQACADALGLHVTTLRYRLQRMHELFRIELDTPDRRFALQLALRFQDVLAPSPVPDRGPVAPASCPPQRRRRRGAPSPEC